MTWQFTLTGLFIGTLVGMTGMGGGSLMTPILILLFGFIVGLTSVGSGTFFGLMMLLLFPLATVQIVGTDILQAAALLWVAGFGHFVAGNVNLHATGWLLVGSIPGVLIGSHLSVRLPDRLLRVALSATLSLSGIKLLDLPHGDAIVVAGLGLWVAGLTFWGVRWHRGKRLVPIAGTD